ncbi:hypothetical protein HMI51_00550 [Corallococcus coralloides]|nr:hypothetical protein [Corallococcus coralloides]
MGIELSISLIAGAISALLGALLTHTSKRLSQERSKGIEEIERIAKIVQAEESARKTVAVEKAAERIPQGLSPEQFTRLIERIAERLPPPSEPRPVQTAVEQLISGYHEQALEQAKAQFWFSIVAATVGFAWILYSGTGIDAGNLATISKILPGVVMDAVAFLFFRQASETRQRATEFYDRLRRDKQLTESVALVSAIEDVRVRSAVKAQIALHMSGLQPSPINLGQFLSASEVERPPTQDPNQG